jgi:protoporphyrinogen oxidase
MRGSFGRLIETLGERIAELGGEFHLSEAVKRIDRDGGGFRITTRGATHRADRVVVATPVPDHLEIAGHLLDDTERQGLERLRATGAICTVLEMSRSLTPYYWLNIADPEMPFGGLIEHTNYIPRERYDGRHILYVSNYLFPDHPMYRAPKAEILKRYLPALSRINPEFDDSWILASHHFRADYAQPVVTRGYREVRPAMRTTVPGIYLCCMAQIFPEDRGQNYAVIYGEKVARVVLEDLEGGAPTEST